MPTSNLKVYHEEGLVISLSFREPLYVLRIIDENRFATGDEGGVVKGE
jgi:hypothetical protein